jgi:hypothetical protein
MSAHTNKSGDPIPLLQKKTKKWVTYTTWSRSFFPPIVSSWQQPASQPTMVETAPIYKHCIMNGRISWVTLDAHFSFVRLFYYCFHSLSAVYARVSFFKKICSGCVCWDVWTRHLTRADYRPRERTNNKPVRAGPAKVMSNGSAK